MNNTLFQTFRSEQLPPRLRQCVSTFTTLNPGIEVEFYDDDACDEFIEEELGNSREAYLLHRRGIFRADIWRCAALLARGGVYADLDIACLRPLDELLGAAREAEVLCEDTEVLLTTDHLVHERQHFRGRRMYMNDFMMALKPGAELFRRYLERVGQNTGAEISRMADDPVHLTGPGVLTDLIEEAGGPEALHVGVLPWQWVHPLPDMSLEFPEWEEYDRLIRSGEWFLELETPPFLAHYWWHSYLGGETMMNMYGDLLFQSAGVLAERRLEKYADWMGDRAETMGAALAEFAQRFGDPENGASTVVEFGVARSFVIGDQPGCALADRLYWRPEEPEKWDWGAGIFTRVAADVLQGLGASYHGIDPDPKAIEISRTMLEDRPGDFHFHQMKASAFLKQWKDKAGSVGLLYMDHAEATEKTAWLHADDARSILGREILAPGGLVLIDDHEIEQAAEEVSRDTPEFPVSSVTKAPGRRYGDGRASLSRYSRRIFEEAGFTVLAEGARQLLLQAPVPAPKRAGIPQVIHQTWKSQFVGEPFRREWMDSWMEVNAGDGWEHRFWTDSDLETFVAEEFPEFLGVYRGYDEHIKRVDAARYLILKRLGGVYVDLDFACLKPLDDLLGDASLLFGYQSTVRPNGARPDAVCNAFMASVPEHPFWEGIEADLARSREEMVVKATGPDFLTARVAIAERFLPADAWPRVVGREALYPLAWDSPKLEEAAASSVEELRRAYPASYAVTFWTGTWRKEERSIPPLEPQYGEPCHLKFAVVMRTADRTPRRNYLEETLASLSRSGLFSSGPSSPDFTLTLFDSGVGESSFIGEAIAASIAQPDRHQVEVVPAERRFTPNENSERALRGGAERAGDDGWVVFVEDDLWFCRDWLGSIERWLCAYAVEERRLYTFHTNASSDEVADQRDDPIDGFFGTQCYALRSPDAVTAAAFSEKIYRRTSGHDMMLKEWAFVHWPQYDCFSASVPSFVRHMGEESSIQMGPLQDCDYRSFPGEDWTFEGPRERLPPSSEADSVRPERAPEMGKEPASSVEEGASSGGRRPQHYVIEFVAGLGDNIRQIHKHDTYQILDLLEPGDVVDAIICTHNAHSHEILYHHPKRSQIRLHHIGYKYKEFKEQQGLSEHELIEAAYEFVDLPTENRVLGDPIPDHEIVWHGAGLYKEYDHYLVFSPWAGLGVRQWPRELSLRVLRELLGRGHFVVGLGRGAACQLPVDHPNFVNLLHADVPSALELVQHSRGFIGAHSSLIQEAWFRDVPTLALHPPGLSDMDPRRFPPGTRSYRWGIRKWNCTWADYGVAEDSLGKLVEEFIGSMTGAV